MCVFVCMGVGVERVYVFIIKKIKTKLSMYEMRFLCNKNDVFNILEWGRSGQAKSRKPID